MRRRPRDQVREELLAAAARVFELLQQIQTGLFERARKFRDENTFEVNSYDEFKKKLDEPGGFLLAHWDGTRETEDIIKNELKVTIRCIPSDAPHEEGKCVRTGRPSTRRVVFAKAY